MFRQTVTGYNNVLVFPHLVCDTFDITFSLFVLCSRSEPQWVGGWVAVLGL